MNIPPKYEDVVAQLDAAEVIIQAGEHVESHLEKQIDILRIDLDAALGREAALREELERANSRYDREVLGLNNEGDPIGGDPAGGYKNDNARLQQRLTVAEQREAELEGLLREVANLDPRGEFLGWQLDGKIEAALKPAEEGEEK